VSPLSLIGIQRRFSEIGRIRAGAKSDRGAPTKLNHWRLTSANKPALDAAAAIYGGEVRPWTGGPNEGLWELFTESDTLRILVPPSAEPYSLWYESWSGGGCDRRCDGERDVINDAPCACDPEARTCKPTLRVSVMLPDLPGLGVWRWEGHGINAALELPATLDLLAHAVSRGEFLPGFLRLEQRSTKKKGEGTRRFAVPVIDLAATIGEVTKAIGGPAVPDAPALEAPATRAQLEAPATTPAEATEPDPDPAGGKKASTAQKRFIFAKAKELGIAKDDVSRIYGMVVTRYGASLSELAASDVDRLVRSLEAFSSDVKGATAKLEAWEAVQGEEPGPGDEAGSGPAWGPAPPIPHA
jgi:hypothetical protein